MFVFISTGKKGNSLVNLDSTYWKTSNLVQVSHLVLKNENRNKNNCKTRIEIQERKKGNFRENICSEDDLRSRIFGAFVVKFLACLPLLGFSNIYKIV